MGKEKLNKYRFKIVGYWELKKDMVLYHEKTERFCKVVLYHEWLRIPIDTYHFQVKFQTRKEYGIRVFTNHELHEFKRFVKF